MPKRYEYEIPITEDMKLNLNSETELYEYDENLSEIENIKRKFALKHKALSLYLAERNCDAVKFYELLTTNSYFKNDWWPYRQICVILNEERNYESNLENIKNVFLSGVYLNDYQLI